MATYTRFEDLEIWQKARTLCQWVQTIVETTPLKSNLRLKIKFKVHQAQPWITLQRVLSALGNKEFIYFLFVAKGSAGEVRSQLYRLLDNKYISKATFEEKRLFLEELSQQINRFINFLKQSDYKGWHFKEEQAEYEKDEPND